MTRFITILISSLALQAQDFVPFLWTTTPSTGNHLTPDIIAYWRFEETTGGALDSSPNGRDLAENGVVGTAAGVVSNNRTYADDDETDYLYRSPESVFAFAGDFTITAWVLLDNAPPATDDKTIISKGDFAGSNFSWWLEFDNAGASSNFRFYWSTDGTWNSGQFVSSDLGSTASEADYYFVVVRRTGSTLHVSATFRGDPLTADTTGTSSGAYYDDGTADLQVGNLVGSTIHDMRGAIDEMGVWGRYLSDCEVEWLYTARDGTFTYPSFDPYTCANPPSMLALDWDTESGALEWDTTEGAAIRITN